MRYFFWCKHFLSIGWVYCLVSNSFKLIIFKMTVRIPTQDLKKNQKFHWHFGHHFEIFDFFVCRKSWIFHEFSIFLQLRLARSRWLSVRFQKFQKINISTSRDLSIALGFSCRSPFFHRDPTRWKSEKSRFWHSPP